MVSQVYLVPDINELMVKNFMMKELCENLAINHTFLKLTIVVICNNELLETAAWHGVARYIRVVL